MRNIRYREEERAANNRFLREAHSCPGSDLGVAEGFERCPAIAIRGRRAPIDLWTH